MRIGFVNGCFDLLHAGHAHMLCFAAKNCDYLIVAVNNDESVKHLKGEDRPANALRERIEALSRELRFMPHAIIPFDGSPDRLIMEIRPNVVIVGHDHYDGEDHIVLRGHGWKEGKPIHRVEVIPAPYLEGVSTTAILKERNGK